jgi:glutaredoxin
LKIAQVRVRIFTTSQWPYAREAKEYLSQKNINYKEIDINQDRSGREELIRLTGRPGVPTIDVEGEVIEGWGPGAGDMVQQKILEHAKAKR